MIEIQASTAFMLYLGSALVVLAGIWIGHHFRSRARYCLPSESLLLVCEYCQCVYLDDPSATVTQCPDCESYNRANVYKGKK